MCEGKSIGSSTLYLITFRELSTLVKDATREPPLQTRVFANPCRNLLYYVLLIMYVAALAGQLNTVPTLVPFEIRHRPDVTVAN